MDNQQSDCTHAGARRPTIRCNGVAAMFVTAAVMALVGCGEAKRANNEAVQPSPSATARDDHKENPSNASVSDPAVPPTAPAHVQARMRAWLAQNELCRGSTDAATTDVACPKSEHFRSRLERQGWCWSYADWRVVTADYRWHRCSEKTLAGKYPEELSVTTASDGSAAESSGGDIPIGQLNPNLSPARQRRLQDAREAIRENWNIEGLAVRKIAFAYSCGLIDSLHTSVAIQYASGSGRIVGLM